MAQKGQGACYWDDFSGVAALTSGFLRDGCSWEEMKRQGITVAHGAVTPSGMMRLVLPRQTMSINIPP